MEITKEKNAVVKETVQFVEIDSVDKACTHE